MADKIDNKTHDYENFSKDELIRRIRDLESKNKIKSPSKQKRRPFKWNSVTKRRIFLKFLYFGWDYHGYASQVDSTETIEEDMFEALQKCCLVEDRENCNYQRCGRTDAGVSAFSQVISLDVRSKVEDPNEENASDELQYCKMLNRILPIHIRCYAWCHVGSSVSSRFDCTSRSYSYYFPRGRLDIEAMRTSANFLLGSHDFRNLCKMDVNNGVVQFTRTISEVSILPVNPNDETSEYQVMKFAIKSRGFLYHQIRCIMAVLLMVGGGNETPTIIQDLLDIEKNPCKPQYQMAAPEPLSLSQVDYDQLNLKWVHSPQEIQYLCGQLQRLWTEFAIKETMIRDSLTTVSSLLSNPGECSWQRQDALVTGVLPKNHIALAKRPKCQSLKDRIQSVEKKKKKRKMDDTPMES